MENQSDEPYFIKFANDESVSVKLLSEPSKKGGGYISPRTRKDPSQQAPMSLFSHRSIGDVFFYDGLRVNGEIIPERMSKFISRIWNSVRNILNQIINDEGTLNESENLQFIIKLKERIVKKYEVANGKLIETTGVFEHDKLRIDVTPQWLIDVPSSLIEFLMTDDLQRLKKCPFCMKFFIAKDAKRKICYKQACRNEYHRKDMANRRNIDPVKYC